MRFASQSTRQFYVILVKHVADIDEDAVSFSLTLVLSFYIVMRLH